METSLPISEKLSQATASELANLSQEDWEMACQHSVQMSQRRCTWPPELLPVPDTNGKSSITWMLPDHSAQQWLPRTEDLTNEAGSQFNALTSKLENQKSDGFPPGPFPAQLLTSLQLLHSIINSPEPGLAASGPAIGSLVVGVLNSSVPTFELRSGSELSEQDEPDPSRHLADTPSDEASFPYCQNQWLHVELPLTLGFLMSQLEAVQLKEQLASRARDNVTLIVNNWLDNDGLPNAALACDFGMLIASWARCRLIANAIGCEFDEETTSLLEWAAGQFLRTTINGKGLLLGPQLVEKTPAAAIRAILQLTTDQNDLDHASRLFKSLGQIPNSDQVFDLGSPPSAVSEWGETAFLRATWKPSSPVIAIDFSDGQLKMEIARKRKLVVGDTTPILQVGGRELEPVSSTEVVCWNSDEDVDILELQTEYEDGVILQRQIVFGREDEFLMIGDAITQNSTQHESVSIRTRLPLANGISAFQEGETNEVYLGAEKIFALVVPLSCNEWKAEKQNGVLTVSDNCLELSHERDATHLWSGVFLDLRPKRATKPRTWRQLTVAEDRRICSDDEAVAFRVQIGKDQWVVYRSLVAPANRTFFGENLQDEFFMGRFSKSGMETLVKIQ